MHEPRREAMDPCGKLVVRAGVFDEFRQAALELAIAFAQHRHLALQQGDGGAAIAGIGQPQTLQKLRVALEEVRKGFQVLGHGRIVGCRGDLPRSRLACHIPTSP